MAGSVYALLVGIDAYDRAPLLGCVNDVTHVRDFLAARLAGRGGEVKALLNADATREAVVDGLRTHLTKAGEDDVAFFYYSGHGSRERTNPEFWFAESSGWNSTLVCSDSRQPGRPVWDLADKELGVLLDAVAARGPHVLAVLDSCHSGGGTRGVVLEEAQATDLQFGPSPVLTAVREMPPIDGERPLESYLPELRSRSGPAAAGAPASQAALASGNRSAGGTRGVVQSGAPGGGRHVALFACESFQKAREVRVDAEQRGAFSVALEQTLSTLGRNATYQDLMVTLRPKVTAQVRDQYPLLFVVDPADVHLPFLGGSLVPVPETFSLAYGPAGWTIDGGAAHGVAGPVGAESTVLAVLAQPGRADAEPPNVEPVGGPPSLGTVRVVRVEATFSRVEADPDTMLDETRVYRTVVVGTPLPVGEVLISGPLAEEMRQALATSGPEGTASPHVRAVERHEGTGVQLDVEAEPGRIRIMRSDGSPIAEHTEDGTGFTVSVGTSLAVGRTIRDLEHVARWEQVRRLDNPCSTLAGTVRLWLAKGSHEERAPSDLSTLLQRRIEPDGNGVIRLSYTARRAEDAPNAFVVLENNGPREVFAVVLDLTDGFKLHTTLEPGVWLHPGRPIVAWGGYAAQISLPEARLRAALDDGSAGVALDWFKVIVAEQRFESSTFTLPALGEPEQRHRGMDAPISTIDRIAGRALARSVSDRPPPGAIADWATVTVEVVTQLPAPLPM